MIPGDWGKRPLSEIAFIQTGIAKGARKINDPVELPYLRVANVQDGYLDLSHIKTIELERNKIERYRLKAGDVLLTEGGDFDKLGRGTVWRGEVSECVHQNHVFIARVNTNIVLPEFLSILTGSSYGKSYFLSCSKQSTNLASINSTQLKEFPVLIPPLPEQMAIVDLLSIWDAVIEKTEQLIIQKEHRLNWLARNILFSDSGKSKQFYLRDVCEPITRKNDVGESNVLTTSAKHGLVSQLEYYNKSVSAEDVSGYYLLKKGEFAYNRSSSKGYPYGAIKRLDLYKQGVLSTLYICFAITDKKKCDSDFLMHAFEFGGLNRQLVCVCQEGARSHGLLNITKSDFFGLTIALPSLPNQKIVANTLNNAQLETDLLNLQVAAYRKQKRGLMQQLLSGKVRLRTNGESTDAI